MDPYELIMKRRSIRNFDEREIPRDVVDRLCDAAVNAPSGGNIQPFSVILVREPERRQALAEIVGNQPWVRRAPLSMVFCIDFSRIKRWAALLDTDFRGEEALSHFFIAYADLMCAAHNVVILAESYGLGSVYIGTIQTSMDPARDLLETPEFVLPMMLLSVGYPRTVPKKVPKMEARAMVFDETYKSLSEEAIRKAFENKYGGIEDNLQRFFERTFMEAVEADRQGGAAWVEEIKAKMNRLEIKNNAQFLFKLRYPSNVMVRLNESIVESFRKAGFRFRV